MSTIPLPLTRPALALDSLSEMVAASTARRPSTATKKT